MFRSKNAVEDLLATAAIEINGNQPHDIQVKNEDFYRRVLQQGSLGLGESYMEGWWDCEELDEFFYRLFIADIEKKIKSSFDLKWLILKARLLNRQTKKKG